MYRSVKNELAYLKARIGSKQYDSDSNMCLFCKFEESEPGRIIDQNKSILVVKNIYPYDFWDYFKVLDHIMIVPKRHVTGMHELSPKEATDYWALLSKYEAKHYNFYARAGSNKTKSVFHQHGHLIKTGGRATRMLLYLRKPRIRLHK